MATINAQPPVLDLALYAGDGISFRLFCKDSDGDSVNITGTVKAQVRLNRTPENTLVVDFTSDLANAEEGVITLSLTGDQTEELMTDDSANDGKFDGVWDLEWDPDGGEPRTLCQGKVECVADVTK